MLLETRFWFFPLVWWKRLAQILNRRYGENLSRTRKFTLATVAAAAMAAPFAIALVNAPQLRAQDATQNWEQTAGGKMSFDVASVKRTTVFVRNGSSNVPLGSGDAFPPNGGLFSDSNTSVEPLISFAYKLNIPQSRDLESQLPGWARSGPNSERFDIEARAPAGTTKDQMRLMMQSLLADRFGFKAHFENRQEHAYALVLVKAGRTGPNLQPHSDDTPCPDPEKPAVSGLSLVTTPAGYPAICGVPISMLVQGGAATIGGRNVSMRMICEGLEVAPNLDVDREVVDQTGLAGNFDFIMKYVSQPLSATNTDPAGTGQDFSQALKDQLGLKLQPTTAPLDVLVVEHVEEPTPN